MQKCTSKSVRTSTAKKENVLSTAKATMVMFVASLFILVACEKEKLAQPASDVTTLKDSINVLVEHYAQSERTLSVSATPADTLAKSDVLFDLVASMYYGDESGTRYNLKLSPNVYFYVVQSKPRIEVGSEAELLPTLVKKQVVNRVPFNNGTYMGEDAHVQYTYSDGNVDDIHFGWKALSLVSDGDTLATPHVELTSLELDTIYVAPEGEQTELDKPHRLTTKYTMAYTSKGVTGQQVTSKVTASPWRIKSITDVEQVLTGEPTYTEKWIGCPITAYELTQTAPTNKGVVTTTKTFPVSLNITVPELREQPSLDSLFAASSSKSAFKCEVLGDSAKNADGFVGLTYTGFYTSKNTGKENGTSIESTATFTYTVPVKFENKWGSYDIKAPELSFAEGGFSMESVSADADFHSWKTTNTIVPTFGTCELDALDEVVRITVAKEKPVYVLPVDSTYEWSGSGDKYIITKKVIYSDGSKVPSTFPYDGRHSVSPTNFGEKITSSLNWNASGLKANGKTTENDKKEFTPVTRFEVVYTTTNEVATATNGVENGSFGFKKTSPIVTFIDGDTKLTCPERKLEVVGQGATPANNYNIVVRDGVSYKGYTYNYSCGIVFDNVAEADVTSQGLLLMVADEVGETQYKYEYSWSGNTITVKTTKTTPHSFAEDEVEVYTTSYTVSMTDLQDGRVDAENNNFNVQVTNTEKVLDEVKDGFYTIQPRQRDYTYVVSNGTVSRQMNNTVTDAVIAFNDGHGIHNWNAQLSVSKNDAKGATTTDGDYQVTPLTTTATAKATGTGAPTLSAKGVTNIYVEVKKEITYKVDAPLDEVVDGEAYYNITVSRLVNGQVEKSWPLYLAGVSFGTYKPSVNRQIVSEFKIGRHDDGIDDLPELTRSEKQGKNGEFEVKITAKEYHFRTFFNAPLDADGNTEREVSGHINVWSSEVIFTDPDNDHKETISFKGLAESVKSDVENETYIRQINVTCNGQILDRQQGVVALKLPQ